MSDVTDVVVVGGGIGGASLAYALAGAGLGVTVLEATTEFEDRVRGESLQTWGVNEARLLGVESVLMDAGAHIAPVWKQYQDNGESGEIPMSIMVPGIDGSLNLGHPKACQALLDAAAAAGVAVTRGVRDVTLSGGSSPTVTYTTNGTAHEVSASLVVGADGRASTIRKQVGITLERQEPISYIAGLLIEDIHDVPDDHDVTASDGDVWFLLFHQGGGRARVYLCVGLSGQHRFAGATGTEKFLSACAVSSYPFSVGVAAGTPAGPCATYAGDDTWTPSPYVDGVVLVGDSAGYNDPIVGQGLSIALRDACMVRDLVLDGARTAAAFAPYGAERLGRMERLRFIADVIAVTQAEDAENRLARRAFVGEKMMTMDPEVFPIVVGAFTGPDMIPDELLGPRLLAQIRSA